jgi:hypothetical protein
MIVNIEATGGKIRYFLKLNVKIVVIIQSDVIDSSLTGNNLEIDGIEVLIKPNL